MTNIIKNILIVTISLFLLSLVTILIVLWTFSNSIPDYKFLKNYKGSIVDVGCGNGRDLTYFVNNKLNIIGIDISKNAIEICKKKISKKIHQNLFVNNFIKFNRIIITINKII